MGKCKKMNKIGLLLVCRPMDSHRIWTFFVHFAPNWCVHFQRNIQVIDSTINKSVYQSIHNLLLQSKLSRLLADLVGL